MALSATLERDPPMAVSLSFLSDSLDGVNYTIKFQNVSDILKYRGVIPLCYSGPERPRIRSATKPIGAMRGPWTRPQASAKHMW